MGQPSMTAEQLIQATIAKRIAAGLTTEVEGFRRHHATEAARNAYIARCRSRGPAVHLVLPGVDR